MSSSSVRDAASLPAGAAASSVRPFDRWLAKEILRRVAPAPVGLRLWDGTDVPASDAPRAGTIVGKALEPLAAGRGTIRVQAMAR